MSFKVIITESCKKDIKKLSKKHKSLKSDLITLIEQMETNPLIGTSLGSNCYKIRLAISSKGKGKSGGARSITHVYIEGEIVYLIALYDKSEKETISDKELKELISQIYT